MKALKKDSTVWKLAKRYAQRAHVNSVPVALSADGLTVTMKSLIRGNQWAYTEAELRAVMGLPARPVPVHRFAVTGRAMAYKLYDACFFIDAATPDEAEEAFKDQYSSEYRAIPSASDALDVTVSHVIQLDTPATTDVRYYVATGRVCGDDEDTVMTFTAASDEAATAHFISEMQEAQGIDPDDSSEYAQVFLNTLAWSHTPVTNVASN